MHSFHWLDEKKDHASFGGPGHVTMFDDPKQNARASGATTCHVMALKADTLILGFSA